MEVPNGVQGHSPGRVSTRSSLRWPYNGSVCDSGSVVYSGQGVGLVIDRSLVRLPAVPLPGSQVNSAFHPCGIGKSSTGLWSGVRAGRVHLSVAGNTV